MKPKKKKDREYMAILDQPIEELKKPMGQPVDFGRVISQLLKDSDKKKVNNKYAEQQHTSVLE